MRSAGCYADGLTSSALARLTTGLAAGDPDGELATAWWAAQRLCLAYAIGDLTTTRTHAADLVDILLDRPVPDSPGWAAPWPPGAASTWPYFDTNRTSNGPTEAVNLLIEKISAASATATAASTTTDYACCRTLEPPRIRRRRPRFVA